jgi:hypothetical protein
MNDDFGAQTALQISPAVYRRLFKPRQKQWIEFVKRRTAAKVFIHCDGAIAEIVPDFIEVGIDVLNPVQTSAAAPANTLTAAEKQAGWRLLFDGQSLAGWHGYAKTGATMAIGPGWKAEDGLLKKLAGQKGGDILRLRYRVLVHPGAGQASALEREWQSFTRN